jgi:hypothetical protein
MMDVAAIRPPGYADSGIAEADAYFERFLNLLRGRGIDRTQSPDEPALFCRRVSGAGSSISGPV